MGSPRFIKKKSSLMLFQAGTSQMLFLAGPHDSSRNQPDAVPGWPLRFIKKPARCCSRLKPARCCSWLAPTIHQETSQMLFLAGPKIHQEEFQPDAVPGWNQPDAVPGWPPRFIKKPARCCSWLAPTIHQDTSQMLFLAGP